jgi:cbb3-type cytochrome oxidase maturation protein
MAIIGLLILASLLVALVFVALFIFAVRNGQFEDLDDPPQRILRE